MTSSSYVYSRLQPVYFIKINDIYRSGKLSRCQLRINKHVGPYNLRYADHTVLPANNQEGLHKLRDEVNTIGPTYKKKMNTMKTTTKSKNTNNKSKASNNIQQ